MNNFGRNLVIWVVLSLVLIALLNAFNQPAGSVKKLTYSEFVQSVQEGMVQEVLLQDQNISGKLLDGTNFSSYAPRDAGITTLLMENKVRVKAEPDEEAGYMVLLVNLLPFLIIGAVIFFFMRQVQSSGGKALSFGRSKARLITQEQARVTFEDVAGVDEAKEELTEVVDFLRDPKKFTRLGGRIPKGVLLVGPPGTGKTLLSRAVAGEAGVPFFSISGSDFVEMFVGVGAARVRDLFVQGKKNAPCLIFIDEIDAVGRQRGAGLGGGHDEREQTLNQLLVEMDGFESNEGVILIAATNRPDVLDPALLRPGRFDRQVVVPTPDLKGRRHILGVHSRRTPLSDNVNLDILAKGTPGFSGADLENLVNEAALHAAKMNKDKLDMSDFEEAKDKVLMGKERRSLIMTDEEKRNTAYHEAGHALVGRMLPGTDALHKVTIIPRGRALGVTQYLPEDRHSFSRTYLENRLAMMLGGRAAELVINNEYTTGAGNDIEQATNMARRMVCQYGMSEALGPLNFAERSDEVFIGRDLGHYKTHSEETSRLIDAEIKRFVEDGQKTALDILREKIDVLHAIAAALLERETITGDDVDRLIRGEPLPPFNGGLGKPQPQASQGSQTPPAAEGEGDGQAGTPAQAAGAGDPDAASSDAASAGAPAFAGSDGSTPPDKAGGSTPPAGS
ncbi:ATP-dependent zinc metalloprotease FtsH [Megalodesulfovibrio gigas]|uniref:ATP-dependent zinc metalloprotease FtsH n=1 Tax=Megalodesulfovibrio gigas (strain ATCC 19364 / DSM 1382 / NCIMB 9332 / VKM B-1759) TaxID=1121448 RepID=T2G6M5_MEGG1|nr:ATP-dependent zinc metalloprotease FtsH [Megalodesulfovibrio gigas]AGW12230.1 putative cell division protein FtsH [Megalodesulfovibrio gigas DSM 1382 = ATCC 19364]